MEIEYTNITVLPDQEKFALEKIIERDFKKIKRLLKEENCKLKVHIKAAKKGERKRYNFNYLLITPKKKFSTQTKDTKESGDYDIVKAAHNEMEHLLNEVKHYVRKESGWKKFGIKRLFSRLKEGD